MVGFACYTSYTVALRFSPGVRRAYALEHHGSMPAVAVNDVVFALHALLLSTVQCTQIWLYPGHRQRVSLPCRVFLGLFVVGLVAGVPLVAMSACPPCTWLNFLYALSFVKVGITLTKYIPQVALNVRPLTLTLTLTLTLALTKYIPQVALNVRRRATVGWSIDNVLLDLTGSPYARLRPIQSTQPARRLALLAGSSDPDSLPT